MHQKTQTNHQTHKKKTEKQDEWSIHKVYYSIAHYNSNHLILNDLNSTVFLILIHCKTKYLARLTSCIISNMLVSLPDVNLKKPIWLK